MNQQEICERGETESREARDVCADVDQCHFIASACPSLSIPFLPPPFHQTKPSTCNQFGTAKLAKGRGEEESREAEGGVRARLSTRLPGVGGSALGGLSALEQQRLLRQLRGSDFLLADSAEHILELQQRLLRVKANRYSCDHSIVAAALEEERKGLSRSEGGAGEDEEEDTDWEHVALLCVDSGEEEDEDGREGRKGRNGGSWMHTVVEIKKRHFEGLAAQHRYNREEEDGGEVEEAAKEEEAREEEENESQYQYQALEEVQEEEEEKEVEEMAAAGYDDFT